MARDPAELVEALWNRIWIDRRPDTLDDLIADPYIRHTREGTETTSPVAYGRVLANALDLLRATEVQIDDLVAIDEGTAAAGPTEHIVWARMTLRAVNIQVGEPTTITWMAKFRVADDRVAESWVLHESRLDWTRS